MTSPQLPQEQPGGTTLSRSEEALPSHVAIIMDGNNAGRGHGGCRECAATAPVLNPCAR